MDIPLSKFIIILAFLYKVKNTQEELMAVRI